MDSVDESIDGLGVYICPCYLLIGKRNILVRQLAPRAGRHRLTKEFLG